MQLKQFLATWQGTRSENKFYRFMSLGMVGAILLLAVNAITKDTTVVIAPPELTTAVEISRNEASQEYLEAWTWSVGMMLGNVTPANADFIKTGIEPILAPSIYSEVTTAIDRQIEEIRRDRVTSRFDPREISYEKETNRFFVTGYRVVAGPAAEGKREEATYEMTWVTRNFRPLLTHITTYSGGPLTKAEQERRQQLEERAARVEEQRQRMREGN